MFNHEHLRYSTVDVAEDKIDEFEDLKSRVNRLEAELAELLCMFIPAVATHNPNLIVKKISDGGLITVDSMDRINHRIMQKEREQRNMDT